jgi:hypothetical protein
MRYDNVLYYSHERTKILACIVFNPLRLWPLGLDLYRAQFGNPSVDLAPAAHALRPMAARRHVRRTLLRRIVHLVLCVEYVEERKIDVRGTARVELRTQNRLIYAG